MKAKSDNNEYIIAGENLFYPFKIGWAPYGVLLISYNTGGALYGALPGIGRCYYIQTPASTQLVCDHAREHSKKLSGARAIIKFASDVHMAEIVRCQFYF